VTEAEHPKGIEVVKDSIRKLKLDEEIRRAEGGKTPKVFCIKITLRPQKSSQIVHQRQKAQCT